jgi:Flp pilus assembly protein protease CpaA
MILVTALLVHPVTMMVARTGISRRWLTAASGALSLVLGLLMVHWLGGSDVLFPADPPFIPR